MKIKTKLKKNLRYIVPIFFVVFVLVFYNFVSSSPLNNMFGYAWGADKVGADPAEGLGWLSFNCTNEDGTCSDAGSNNYGVSIDEDTGDITGYAWSSNYGWLKFGGLSGFPTGGSAPSSNWYNSSWTKRVKVTVQASRVSGTVTDFPVYVNLANLPASFHTNVNQTDARDIRVTSADGTTELAREVVFYDSASDTGELHFKAPSLSSGANTDFYIYYANPSATDYAVSATYGRNNVWTNGYSLRYSMHEDPTITAPQFKDSTSNLNNATKQDTISTISGKIGNAVSMNNNGHANFTNQITYAGNFTVSMWWYTTNVGFAVAGLPGANEKIGPWSSPAGKILLRSITSGLIDTSQTTPANNTWHNVVVTRDSNNKIDYYLNGAAPVRLYGDVAQSGSSRWTNFGGESGQRFQGRLDELRFSNVTRSTDWIKTEYNNQNDSATFYTSGAEENYSAGGGSGGTTQANAKFTGDVVNGNFTGTISGWARFCAPAANVESCSGFAENDGNGGWDGWVSLSGTSPNYGVVVNNNILSGYAWGGDNYDKNVVGWIDFNGVQLGQNEDSLNFYASPSPSIPPFNTTLNWSGLNGTTFSSCVADSAFPLNSSSVPLWQGAVATSGNLLVTVPYNPTKYKITCIESGTGITRTSTIYVAKSINESIVLRNTKVSGGFTTLSWTGVNVNSCTATTLNPITVESWTGSKASSGSEANVEVTAVNPDKTTYTLSCVGLYSNLPFSVSLNLHTTSASSSGRKTPVYKEN